MNTHADIFGKGRIIHEQGYTPGTQSDKIGKCVQIPDVLNFSYIPLHIGLKVERIKLLRGNVLIISSGVKSLLPGSGDRNDRVLSGKFHQGTG
jgi:hypothetical protein